MKRLLGVWRLNLSAAVLLTYVAMMAACGSGNELVIGVATSVRDTGLMDELVREFEENNTGVGAVKPIASGSGQLLELARRGEVDAVISHSPEAEAQALAEGDVIDRRQFMHNFFLVVGPEADPAGVADAESAVDAFMLISRSEAPFVSRGDESGTHERELAIWAEAGIDPRGQSWYQESGAGQGTGLLVASDKGAYTLVDSGTWTVLEDRTGLAVYVEDRSLPNVYSVSRVNPERHSVNERDALAFADFVAGPVARAVIERFGILEYGQSLFVPGSPPAAEPEPVPSP